MTEPNYDDFRRNLNQELYLRLNGAVEPKSEQPKNPEENSNPWPRYDIGWDLEKK